MYYRVLGKSSGARSEKFGHLGGGRGVGHAIGRLKFVLSCFGFSLTIFFFAVLSSAYFILFFNFPTRVDVFSCVSSIAIAIDVAFTFASISLLLLLFIFKF